MITRIGNAGDFQAVLPMMRQYRLRQQQLDPALYAPHPDAEGRFLRWAGEIAADPRAMLLVAEGDDGRLVGFLLATVSRDPPNYLHNEFALVREWWVEPAFRGKGVGRALIALAAAEYAAVGIAQIRVRTAGADDEARAVLKRRGFRLGGCEMVMELNHGK